MAKQYNRIHETNLEEIAKAILNLNIQQKIFALYGDMGAGKTTLIRYFCNVLGVTENVSSPTFGLIHTYSSPAFGLIHHFDCYRLKSDQEIQSIGFGEYLYADQYCFIEWPEIIESLLPTNTVKITIITELDPKYRTITLI